MRNVILTSMLAVASMLSLGANAGTYSYNQYGSSYGGYNSYSSSTSNTNYYSSSSSSTAPTSYNSYSTTSYNNDYNKVGNGYDCELVQITLPSGASYWTYGNCTVSPVSPD